MADWRQIQARIRKAKNGRDASAKLSELYQRTRDAMVAWELGAIEEKAEHSDEAIKWYTIAAQRFRRADWKKKAEEALTRLGAPLPAGHSESAGERAPEEHTEPATEPEASSVETTDPASGDKPEVEPDYEPQSKFFGSAHLDQRRGERVSPETGEILPPDVRVGAPAQPAAATAGDDAARRKRRRGRRGGRGRRRGGSASQPALPSHSFAPSPSAETKKERPASESRAESNRGGYERPVQQPAAREPVVYEPAPHAVREEGPAPRLPSERMAHGRSGDPALASRMNHLESLMRRLLGGALHRVSEAEEAPAGPGVFLLSDSDQITSYYVEACQTLRVGIANVVRGRGGKGRSGGRGFVDIDLKARLAEHLGISESKVAQYLKDDCVVRWIQLDDEAAHLAHFAIAVLRTPLNLD